MSDLNKALANVRANKAVIGTPEFINQVALACFYEMRNFVGAENAAAKTTATNVLKLASHLKADQDFLSAHWIACRMATLGKETSEIKINLQNKDILEKILNVKNNDDAKVRAHITDGSIKNADYADDARIIHLRKTEEPLLFTKVTPMITYICGKFTVDIYQKSDLNGTVINAEKLPEIAQTIPMLSGVKVNKTSTNIEFEEVKYHFADRKPGEIISDIYLEYTPDRIIVEGAREHPARLVESRTVAALNGPQFNTKVLLPKNSIASGAISGVQLEPILMAAAAHERFLPSGERMGYFIGDSTGVGKTNEQVGIIANNIGFGRKRHIYLTEKSRHLPNLAKGLRMIGLSPSLIIEAGDYGRYDELPNRDGILFLTFTEIGQTDENGNYVRIDQIQNWLGDQFNGCIIIDESHNLGNAIAFQEKGGFGETIVSNQAVATNILQGSNPNARIVYCSATGLSRPQNLAYMTRLNIWGENNEYTTADQIIGKIEEKGLSALEVLNTHLVSSGLAISRSLSLRNVIYDTLTHRLNDSDTKLWDAVTGILSEIRHMMPDAIAAANPKRGAKPSRTAIGFYEGSCRRIAEMLMMTIKLPTVKKHIQSRLDSGETAVIQLMNTYESLSTTDGETLRASIRSVIEKCLPKYKISHVKIAGLDYNFKTDKDGKYIPTEYIKEIEALEKKIVTIPTIVNPIDSIISTFGQANVAEITGRTKRTVTINGESVIQVRTSADVTADHASFMNDRKRILIFSTGAGGSSMDYHASLDVPNQRVRNHYVMQYGYKATQALQGIGRTHRSHQAQAPFLWLVTSNLPSERIYRSQIINRIRNVGAVNHGNRDASSQSFSNSDNYDSAIASAAINMFIKNIKEDKYPSLPKKTFLKIVNLEDSSEKGIETTTRHRLLSRVARCTSEYQEIIMTLIDQEIENVIEKKIEDRSFDTGPQYIEGRFEKGEVEVLFESKETGSKITSTKIRGDMKFKISSFKKAYQEAEAYALTGVPPRVLFDPKTGRIYIASEMEAPTASTPGAYKIVEPHMSRNSESIIFTNSGESSVFSIKRISKDEAEPLWTSYSHEIEKKFEDGNILVSGSIMAAPSFFFNMNLKPVVVEFKDRTQLFGLLGKENDLDAIKNLIDQDMMEPVPNALILDAMEKMMSGKYLITSSNSMLYIAEDEKKKPQLHYVPNISLIPNTIMRASTIGVTPHREAGQISFTASQMQISNVLRKILSCGSNSIKETLDHPNWSITMS